mgnify:FL=1
MAYQVLARKWRPTNFEQVVGQEHVLQSLINALEQQRLHHAYLFSGTRGVGKTSIARLLAKALNCETGVSATPCGTCSSCVEISQGNFVDLIEIDAASKTKVEDTREILENVQYKPTRGRYKVYLIDEVHMLSRSSFNALLKTLEEPPEHVKFLFATTETQKLPVTILSRCLQFNLKALSVEQIGQQLAHIMQHESVAHDDRSLQMLANAADGSMRDALSLTDQAISYGDGVLSQANVQRMLGTLDPNYSLKILALVHQQQNEQVFELLEEINQFSPDYDKLLKQISLDLHFASLAQIAKQSVRLANQPAELWEFAKAVQPELLQLFYSIVLEGRKELPWAANPRAGFEMIILRLFAFMPAQKKTDLNEIEPPKPSSAETQTKPVSAKQTNVQKHASESEQAVIANLESQQSSLIEQAKTIKAQSNARPQVSEQIEPVNDVQNVAAPSERSQPSQDNTPNEAVASVSGGDSGAPAGFSDDELLNMSMAMAHEEDYVDESDFVPAPEPLQPTPVQQPAVKSAPVSGIDQFLQAKKSLTEKARAAGQTDSSVKKTEAAKSEEKSDSLLRNEIPNETPAPIIEDVDEVVGVVTRSKEPAILASDESVASALVDDPATLLAPNTEDYWSNLIDAMALGGRIRQLGIHSSYEITGNNVTLTLATQHRHLGVETAVQTMQKKLSLILEQPIELAVNIGDGAAKTPFTIAQELHQLRLSLASQCIKDDPAISQFIEQFGAIVDEESIKYRTIKAIN